MLGDRGLHRLRLATDVTVGELELMAAGTGLGRAERGLPADRVRPSQRGSGRSWLGSTVVGIRRVAGRGEDLPVDQVTRHAAHAHCRRIRRRGSAWVGLGRVAATTERSRLPRHRPLHDGVAPRPRVSGRRPLLGLDRMAGDTLRLRDQAPGRRSTPRGARHRHAASSLLPMRRRGVRHEQRNSEGDAPGHQRAPSSRARHPREPEYRPQAGSRTYGAEDHVLLHDNGRSRRGLSSSASSTARATSATRPLPGSADDRTRSYRGLPGARSG